ncbi:hypothetical protein FF125_17460 [Aureibaculum algae]|uniref:Uncharacterized protein n=1 Tax=Aureibaculum algae TaxID=2584122 RepID=A0A5B7TYB8_9FLAO|nr:SdiA-regulated domain-containing protein [Aureibaculum algae]QCX40146.1 hypothetical protein FF125_17460 [Aureibaculum algae]
MSLTGEVLDTLAFVGNDLEGVSTYTEGKLLLAEEVKKEVVELNITDGTTITHAIEYENTTPNSGMEGVTYNSKDKTTYILNEKDPGKLIHLAEDFSIIDEYHLLFAQDYSGIFYDASIDALWIVSDQSKTVNQCNLKGEVIKSYSIDFVKSEGVVIANDKIYIVSDSEEKLYVFDKPDH